jgi:hypothetical protein
MYPVEQGSQGGPAPVDALDELARLTGEPPPPGLSGVDRTAIAALVAALRNVQDQQERELAAAAEEALSHLPSVLRRPVLRLLGGGR